MKLKLVIAVALISAAGAYGWQQLRAPVPAQWRDSELALLQSLSLDALPPLPADASNAVADANPAAELGHRLFFDPRLSGNGTVSCATCHQPEQYYTDGKPLAIGTDIGPRHTPSLVGLSYSPWFYWDGRKDSQWAQALAPLEAGHEHDFTRTELASLLMTDPELQQLYRETFGKLPPLPDKLPAASPLGDTAEQAAWQSLDSGLRTLVNRVFTNAGKALAAYQRKLQPGRSRFDSYVATLDDSGSTRAGELLSKAEVGGLALFIDEAQCVTCHNGPLFSNHEFHNTGVLAVAGQMPGMGRYQGVRAARKDPFNCLGKFSDAKPEQCLELRFARDSNELVGANKTPTLRNVTETAPYMHGGQISELRAVMQHYNEAPVSMLSHNEAKPLALSPAQLDQLVAFMHTLTAPLATDQKWLQPPARKTPTDRQQQANNPKQQR